MFFIQHHSFFIVTGNWGVPDGDLDPLGCRAERDPHRPAAQPPGAPGRCGGDRRHISGIFRAALAGYTGVLVSNTAVPVWNESRRWMPVLFASSGTVAAASFLDLFDDNEAGRRVTRVFGGAARVVELAASHKVDNPHRASPAWACLSGAGVPLCFGTRRRLSPPPVWCFRSLAKPVQPAR